MPHLDPFTPAISGFTINNMIVAARNIIPDTPVNKINKHLSIEIPGIHNIIISTGIK
jgi:hypothetical protein